MGICFVYSEFSECPFSLLNSGSDHFSKPIFLSPKGILKAEFKKNKCTLSNTCVFTLVFVCI